MARLVLVPLFVATIGNAEPVSREDATVFLEMATKREFSDEIFPILKWDVDVARVGLIFEPQHKQLVIDQLLPELRQVRDLIRQETGFTYLFPHLSTEQDPVNVFLSFGEPDEVIERAIQIESRLPFEGYSDYLIKQSNHGQPACAVAAIWSETFQIQAVAISIDSEQEITRCVNKMFLQSMGLVSDAEETQNSVTVEGIGVERITDLDRKMLRLLYRGNIMPNSRPNIESILTTK